MKAVLLNSITPAEEVVLSEVEKKGGVVCHTGILGGVYALNGFDPIKFIPNGVYLTGFYSNALTQEVIDNIFSFIREHNLQPCVGAKYDFSEIKEACVALDSGKANGKIVVEINTTN